MTTFRCGSCLKEKPIRSGYVDYQVTGVGEREPSSGGRLCLPCWGDAKVRDLITKWRALTGADRIVTTQECADELAEALQL